MKVHAWKYGDELLMNFFDGQVEASSFVVDLHSPRLIGEKNKSTVKL
jgi:hypothetical protein